MTRSPCPPQSAAALKHSRSLVRWDLCPEERVRVPVASAKSPPAWRRDEDLPGWAVRLPSSAWGRAEAVGSRPPLRLSRTAHASAEGQCCPPMTQTLAPGGGAHRQRAGARPQRSRPQPLRATPLPGQPAANGSFPPWQVCADFCRQIKTRSS